MSSEELSIIAQNVESAYFQIARVRQVLLDHSLYFEWQQLIEASSVLNTTQSRLCEMLMLVERELP